MTAQAVSYLPFDSLWKMRIDHPYSLIVRDGALLWSCGQCPLDSEGKVLHPRNLLAQAEAVAIFIEKYLVQMKSRPSHIGRLIVYFVETRPTDTGDLRAIFQSAFGEHVQLFLVAIPHFYYDDMMIEVDVFASDEKGESRQYRDETLAITLDVVDAGTLCWASVTISEDTAADENARDAIRQLLAKAGLAETAILSEQWFAPTRGDGEIANLSLSGTKGNCEIVLTTTAVTDISAELTFAKGSVEIAVTAHDTGRSDEVTLHLRKSSGHFHVKASCSSKKLGLVGQTAAIMKAVHQSLQAAGLSFKNVRKATTYYVAGSSAEDLHDNMSVRNSYYTRPGPASTGLPVSGFSGSEAKISISIFGKVE